MTTPTEQPADLGDRPPLDGAALLDGLRAALTRYVILPTPQAADAVTLWIAATHAQPAWPHAPRLVIRAPEKRCGKSRLLDVVEATCHAPFITVNSSPAAVYRSITEDPPTLLVDEADTIFGAKAEGNEDLRGLLNAGHQRNRPAKRYDANANRVESIPTFAMAALAGIGAMPDTIEDRAVVIRMRRRGPGETVAPFRHRRDRPPLRQLAADFAAWLRADLATLEAAEPPMPVEDRAADTWEPLIVVADHAGAHWPDRARAAVLALTADADDNEQMSTRLRLLTDCRTAFGTDTALPTVVLLDRLKADPEAPWGDYGPSGLTAMKLGVLLREYEIRSSTIRFPTGQAKGYQRVDFLDAWGRYCGAGDALDRPAVQATVLPLPGGTRPTRTSLNAAGQPR
ncbi:DNA primase [Mycobacterium tuberculosis]|nr:DNA primase [Mycobacterium tuberculosis]